MNRLIWLVNEETVYYLNFKVQSRPATTTEWASTSSGRSTSIIYNNKKHCHTERRRSSFYGGKEKQITDIKNRNEKEGRFSNPEKIRSEKTLVRSAPPSSISDPANHIEPRPFIRLEIGSLFLYINPLTTGMDHF